MLGTIPPRILTHRCTLEVCTGIDAYRQPTWQAYSVARVHFQPGAYSRLSKDNTEVALQGILFVDARLSTPKLDWYALCQQSEEMGSSMRVTAGGKTYTVLAVDALPDDTGRLHHYEAALV